jgi:peptidoglycan/xylan/chitin deacetylase (PgdA/CDA1 family)
LRPLVHRRAALVFDLVLLVFLGLCAAGGTAGLGGMVLTPGAALALSATGNAEAGTPDVSPADSAAVPVVVEAGSLQPVSAAGQVAAETGDLALAAAERSAAALQRRHADSQPGQAHLRLRDLAEASPPLQLGQAQALMPVRTPGDAVRLPILMYHHIANAPANADAVRRDLSVSPAAFAQQLDYLVAHGYQTVSLSDLIDHLGGRRALPANPIILTFDDGYDDNYSNAYQLLRARNLAATFFIITDYVGEEGYLTWPQIVAMSRDGFSIEAHGRTHLDLSMLGPGDTQWQIAGSKAALEAKLGRAVNFYCYPSGRYTAQTVAILSSNNYKAAVTTADGATQRASGLFDLARIRLRGSDTLDQFVYKVTNTP